MAQSTWWNPLSLLQTDLPEIPPKTQTGANSQLIHRQSQSSLSTASSSHLLEQQQLQNSVWYNPLSWWQNPNSSALTDEDVTDPNGGTVTSIAINKLLKESKRHILKDEPIWAWHQPDHRNLSNEDNIQKNISDEQNDSFQGGELSILGSKSETSPIHLSRYPILNTGGTEDKLKNDNSVLIIPKFQDNFRNITYKTKIRIAFQLYYNFPTETHLYLKRDNNKNNLHESDNNTNVTKTKYKKALIISITKGKKQSHTTSYTISNSIRSAFLNQANNNINSSISYHIDTIAIELGKSSISKDTTEDIFKLLINWRELFLNTEILMITGFEESASIAVELLDVLISRKSFPQLSQSGLILMDISSQPTPTPLPAGSSPLSHQLSTIDPLTLDRLAHGHNTKISIIASLKTIPEGLALEFTHPNIHRFLMIPLHNPQHDNFKTQLFKMLLVCLNLGPKSSNGSFELSKRLLIQLASYFQSTAVPVGNGTSSSNNNTNSSGSANSHSNLPPFIEHIVTEGTLDPVITHQIQSTSLYKPKHVIYDPILADELLENKYNLIWNFHAFLDGFKTLPNTDVKKEMDFLVTSFREWDALINNQTGKISNTNTGPASNNNNLPSVTVDTRRTSIFSSSNGTTNNSQNMDKKQDKEIKNVETNGNSTHQETNQALNLPDSKTKTDQSTTKTIRKEKSMSTIPVRNIDVTAEEKELSQMLEVLKIDDYCACLLGEV